MANLSEDVIKKAYAAFNERDIDKTLSTMQTNVQWSKAWEGGYISGHDEIREYWTRQWKEINPTVEPVGFRDRENGNLEVKVHQNVKDLEGNIISDGAIRHIYTFQDGLIKTMDIELLQEEEQPLQFADTEDNDRFVIPDECGDTMWDAVLKQDEEKDRRAAEEQK